MKSRFRKGQTVYRSAVTFPGYSTGVQPGHKAVIVDDELAPLDGRYLVSVVWDGNPVQMNGRYFEDYFTSEDPNGNVQGKSDDPRTPEKRYADSVDALLHEYAEKMRKGFDGGTMAWPYSHLGLLAEFLMDYDRIEKP